MKITKIYLKIIVIQALHIELLNDNHTIIPLTSYSDKTPSESVKTMHTSFCYKEWLGVNIHGQSLFLLAP